MFVSAIPTSLLRELTRFWGMGYKFLLWLWKQEASIFLIWILKRWSGTWQRQWWVQLSSTSTTRAWAKVLPSRLVRKHKVKNTKIQKYKITKYWNTKIQKDSRALPQPQDPGPKLCHRDWWAVGRDVNFGLEANEKWRLKETSTINNGKGTRTGKFPF